MSLRLSDRFLLPLLAATLLLLSYNYATDLSSPISVYYSEGPVLDQSLRLAQGHNIYPPEITSAPYTINNYGPLYYALQYPFPGLFTGRLISTLSTLASAFFAGCIAHFLTGSKQARIITTILTFSAPLVSAGMPLYRVDPLALALSLAGLYTGLTATTPKRSILSALLLALAIHTKLTYAITAPATLFCFHLLKRKPKQAIGQAAALAFFAALILLLMQHLTHGGYLFNIITANLLDYSPLRALDYFKIAYMQSAIATLTIPKLWQSGLPRDSKRFCTLYLMFACIAASAAGKIGANYGYFAEFQIALALLTGIVFTHRPALGSSITLAQLALYSYFLITSPYHHFLRSNESAMLALQRSIEDEPGIVLADDYMGMLILAGKPIYLEPFEMTQLSRKNLWSQDDFIHDIKSAKFQMILMGEVPLRSERWTPEMLAAIHARYYSAEQTKLVEIWRPR